MPKPEWRAHIEAGNKNEEKSRSFAMLRMTDVGKKAKRARCIVPLRWEKDG
jgi:hypothetical protein